MEWPQWSQEPGRRHLWDVNIVSSVTLAWSDLESWYSELYRASLFKERWSGLDATLRPMYGGSCHQRQFPLITHMSDVPLLPSYSTTMKTVQPFNADYILLIWKNSNVEETNGRVWCTDSSLGGSHRPRQGQTDVDNSEPKMGPRSLRSTFLSLLWSGWFQNLV